MLDLEYSNENLDIFSGYKLIFLGDIVS